MEWESHSFILSVSQGPGREAGGIFSPMMFAVCNLEQERMVERPMQPVHAGVTEKNKERVLCDLVPQAGRSKTVNLGKAAHLCYKDGHGQHVQTEESPQRSCNLGTYLIWPELGMLLQRWIKVQIIAYGAKEQVEEGAQRPGEEIFSRMRWVLMGERLLPCQEEYAGTLTA